MPTAVLEPVDANEAASMLADAARQRVTLLPRGSGTKLALTPEALTGDGCLSTRRLDSPVQHFSGDLVATLPAGVTLAGANAVLAQAGQWLPLDPPFADRATIGGIVAANDSGPRRQKYGAPRDLIIGVELALCDGRVAKAGGRVVKNVAGYDLSRLVCGSFGSLAVITSATFKLAPLPAASRTIVAACDDLRQAARLALEVASQPTTPAALEITAPSPQLLVRFESTRDAADQMAAATRALLQDQGVTVDLWSGSAEQELWTSYNATIWDKPGAVAKISVLPTNVEDTLTLLHRLERDVDWSAVGRAALGVLLVRINASAFDVSFSLERLRQHVQDRRGTLVILRGSAADHRSGHSVVESNARTVMQAVKSQFDPMGVLPHLPGIAPGS